MYIHNNQPFHPGKAVSRKTVVPFFSIVLLVTVLFISGHSESQNSFNVAFHEPNEKAADYLLAVGEEVYFNTIGGSANAPFKVLYKYDAQGQRLSANFGGFDHVSVMYTDSIGNIVISGNDDICSDIWQDTINLYGAVHDPSGKLLVSVSSPTLLYGNWLRGFRQYSDGLFGMFTQNTYFLLDASSQVLNTVTFSFTVNSSLPLHGDRMLLSVTDGNNHKLVVLNKTGAVVTIAPAASAYGRMKFFGQGKVMGQSGSGHLHAYSPGLALLRQGTVQATSFDVRDGDVAILRQSGQTTTYILQDTSFSTLHSAGLTIAHFTATGISIHQQDVCLLGFGKSAIASKWYPGNGSEHYYTALHRFGKTSFISQENDASLVKVEMDSVSVTQQSGVTIYKLQPVFTIKNTGTAPINSIKVNHWWMPAISCGVWTEQKLFSNLSILPGDSQTVTSTTDLWSLPPFTVPSSGTFSFNMCFYLSVPNGETDSSFPGNELCQTFHVTGISELFSDADLRVGPVPSQDELRFEASVVVDRVELLDLHGRTLLTSTPASKNGTLSLAPFSSGIYFLRLQSGTSSITRKVLRE